MRSAHDHEAAAKDVSAGDSWDNVGTMWQTQAARKRSAALVGSPPRHTRFLIKSTLSTERARRRNPTMVIEELAEKRYLGKMRQRRQRRVSGVSGAELRFRFFGMEAMVLVW